MPKISVSVTIKSDKQKVYELIKDMESFPRFMRDVKSIKIINRLDSGIVTAWETEVEGTPLMWKEEVNFDDQNLQAKFDLVEGSYEAYHGSWSVRGSRNNNAKLILEANFDWGIPILEKYVGRALEEKARKGLLGMLLAIKKEAERANV